MELRKFLVSKFNHFHYSLEFSVGSNQRLKSTLFSADTKEKYICYPTHNNQNSIVAFSALSYNVKDFQVPHFPEIKPCSMLHVAIKDIESRNPVFIVYFGHIMLKKYTFECISPYIESTEQRDLIRNLVNSKLNHSKIEPYITNFNWKKTNSFPIFTHELHYCSFVPKTHSILCLCFDRFLVQIQLIDPISGKIQQNSTFKINSLREWSVEYDHILHCLIFCDIHHILLSYDLDTHKITRKEFSKQIHAFSFNQENGYISLSFTDEVVCFDQNLVIIKTISLPGHSKINSVLVQSNFLYISSDNGILSKINFQNGNILIQRKYSHGTILNTTMLLKIFEKFWLQVKFICFFRFLLFLDTILPPTIRISQSQVIPVLVKFLHPNYPVKLRCEAAWAITNIASSYFHCCSYVVTAGAIPPLVQILSEPHHALVDQAVWALGNIAGNSTTHRNLIIDAEAVDAFISILRTKNVSSKLRKNATWALSNLVRGAKSPATFNKVKKTIPHFAHLMFDHDVVVKIDALWAISFLTNGPPDQIDAVLNVINLHELQIFLKDTNETICTAALRTIGNLVKGSVVHHTAQVISANLVPDILNILTRHLSVALQKEAAWTISNIAAGPSEHITALLAADAITPLLHSFKFLNKSVQKEASWAIANIAAGATVDDVRIMVQKHNQVVERLVRFLRNPDPRLVEVALESILNIMTAGVTDSLSTSNVNHMVRLFGEMQVGHALNHCLSVYSPVDQRGLFIKARQCRHFLDEEFIHEDDVGDTLIGSEGSDEFDKLHFDYVDTENALHLLPTNGQLNCTFNATDPSMFTF